MSTKNFFSTQENVVALHLNVFFIVLYHLKLFILTVILLGRQVRRLTRDLISVRHVSETLKNIALFGYCLNIYLKECVKIIHIPSKN